MGAIISTCIRKYYEDGFIVIENGELANKFKLTLNAMKEEHKIQRLEGKTKFVWVF